MLKAAWLSLALLMSHAAVAADTANENLALGGSLRFDYFGEGSRSSPKALPHVTGFSPFTLNKTDPAA